MVLVDQVVHERLGILSVHLGHGSLQHPMREEEGERRRERKRGRKGEREREKGKEKIEKERNKNTSD